MKQQCTHLGQIHDVKPSADGCEECLQMGDTWVHTSASAYPAATWGVATRPRTSMPRSTSTPRNIRWSSHFSRVKIGSSAT